MTTMPTGDGNCYRDFSCGPGRGKPQAEGPWDEGPGRRPNGITDGRTLARWGRGGFKRLEKLRETGGDRVSEEPRGRNHDKQEGKRATERVQAEEREDEQRRRRRSALVGCRYFLYGGNGATCT